MATVTFKGNKMNTVGDLPKVGTKAPDFTLTTTDLSDKSLSDFEGKRIIMNIFPSLDTETCANSVRNFNERASQLENTTVLCISRDTPFAQNRFLESEKIEDVVALSDIRSGKFGRDYNLLFAQGPLEGFHSRVVLVLDEEGKIIYQQQVLEVTEEPDYLSALKSLM